MPNTQLYFVVRLSIPCDASEFVLYGFDVFLYCKYFVLQNLKQVSEPFIEKTKASNNL